MLAMKRLMAVVLAGLMASPAFAVTLAANAPPNVIVQEKTNQILHLIEQKRHAYKAHRALLYKMVNRRIVPYFDFARMSRWVLGRYWRQATPSERQQFTVQFTDLMVRTYATALLSYSGQRIVYLPYRQNAGSRHVMVRTEIRQNNGGPAIPINYMFVDEKGAWKVDDVTIDNVSLVTNYRSVYATKIRRDGLKALIASMARANHGVP